MPPWPTFHQNTILLLSSCPWNRSIKHFEINVFESMCLSTPSLHLFSLTAFHTCFLPSLTSSTHPCTQVPFPQHLRQLLFVLSWRRTTLTQITWETIALSLTFCSFPSFLRKLSFSSSTTTCQITTTFILSSLPTAPTIASSFLQPYHPPSNCKRLTSCLWLQKRFASHTSILFCCLWHYWSHHSSHPPRIHI